MKKFILFGLLFISMTAVQANAQCEKTYLLCKKQFTKAEKKGDWNVNQQSEGIAIEKGQVYEATVTAYVGLEYRLSLCTDIDGGTPINFQLSEDTRKVKVDSLDNTTITVEREVIFDNSVTTDELYILFRSNQTKKYYITASIPTAGKSKKNKNPDFVCIGMLLEHRKTKKSAF